MPLSSRNRPIPPPVPIPEVYAPAAFAFDVPFLTGPDPVPGVVLVFGSNNRGRHGAGAAKTAMLLYGARYGTGRGPSGRAYAIVTKDLFMRPVSLAAFTGAVSEFMDYARAHPETWFLVTRVGCGLAGFSDAAVAGFFASCPGNCILPRAWEKHLAKFPVPRAGRVWHDREPGPWNNETGLPLHVGLNAVAAGDADAGGLPWKITCARCGADEYVDAPVNMAEWSGPVVRWAARHAACVATGCAVPNGVAPSEAESAG